MKYLVACALFAYLLIISTSDAAGKCRYPKEVKSIDWEKFKGKTFYQTLNDGDPVSRDIACVKLANITRETYGASGTMTRYIFNDFLPNVMTIHTKEVSPGFYLFDENDEGKLIQEDVAKNGEVDLVAMMEDRDVVFEDAEFLLTDYETYLLFIRCDKSGRWYSHPNTINSIPTVEDVLRIWKVMSDNGIDDPLLLSHCENVM